jgi:uncharacterized Zn finger protein
MRDNEERFSALQGIDSPAAVQQSSGGDSIGLNFTSPTEIVELPSKGKFYPKEHPLHGKEEIEIKFMTAKEEDILTSKALIKKGVAVDRMLQNLILDKSVKVEDLLVGDKNALIVAARISGYGEEYGVEVTCPSCEEKSKHTFDLSLLGTKEAEDLEEIAVRQTENGTFLTKLYKTNVEVEFRLLYGKDETAILNEMAMKKGKTLQVEKNSTSQLKRIILSVNGVTDRMQIANFVDNMPAIDSRQLRTVLRRINPEVDMNQTFECASCGHEEEMEVPFTVEFFWPK